MRYSTGFLFFSVIYCQTPVAPVGGFVDKSLEQYPFRTSVRYSCRVGFKIDGTATGECNENGTWGVVPACIGKYNA